MEKSKKIIPYWVLPGFWGLSGDTKKRAIIEYELTGYEREIALAQLESDYPKLISVQLRYNIITKYEYDNLEAEYTLSGDDLALRKLEIEHAYDKISDFDFESRSAAITYTGDELIAKNLEIDFKFGKLTNSQYEKALATHNKEPWVNLAEFDFKQLTNKSGLSVELEYNEYFVNYLKDNGYYSANEDEMVHTWFVNLCRQIANEDEDYDGDEISVAVVDIDKNRKSHQ